jgi:hypothetical protein
MTKEQLIELLKISYRWGRDNGEGRSEKNFNDLLATKAVNEALYIHVIVGSSEQLKAIEDLKELAYEVCPLHRTDDLDGIIERL